MRCLTAASARGGAGDPVSYGDPAPHGASGSGDATEVEEHVPWTQRHVPDGSAEQAAKGMFEMMRCRRSVRHFSDRPVSRETMEWLVRCGTTAPSGANKQPWRFVCIQDAETKKAIRAAAEEEEREFYGRRASDRWLKDLKPFGTNPVKEFLEVAPWVVVLFKLMKEDDGSQVYYVNESVGLAAGMFLTACNAAGLATLTHTPSPMGFLSKVLGRPDHERPFLLIPVGYPAAEVLVPKHALERKPLDQVMGVK